MRNIIYIRCHTNRMVVICFQMSIFVQWETSPKRVLGRSSLLWFAFKCLSLCSEKHLDLVSLNLSCSCDLLSNVYLCAVRNIRYAIGCFLPELWFAFKCLSLCSEKHPYSMRLLSRHVVICFQMSIFVQWETSSAFLRERIHTLWFAFKCLSLCSEKHQRGN